MEGFKPILEEYNPEAGSTVKESITKAMERAKEKDCTVVLNFNGVKMFVVKNSKIEFLLDYYHYEMHVSKYKDLVL